MDYKKRLDILYTYLNYAWMDREATAALLSITLLDHGLWEDQLLLVHSPSGEVLELFGRITDEHFMLNLQAFWQQCTTRHARKY